MRAIIYLIAVINSWKAEDIKHPFLMGTISLTFKSNRLHNTRAGISAAPVSTTSKEACSISNRCSECAS